MLRRKLKIYVETSVWNFLIAEDVPTRRAITEKFFEDCDDFAFFVSPLTLREIERARQLKRDQLEGLITRYNPILLEEVSIIEDLADEYIGKGIFPLKFKDDAIHVAFACYYAHDILLSWNFQHIVKYKVKNEVKAANIIFGYRTPDIVSPEEMLDNG